MKRKVYNVTTSRGTAAKAYAWNSARSKVAVDLVREIARAEGTTYERGPVRDLVGERYAWISCAETWTGHNGKTVEVRIQLEESAP